MRRRHDRFELSIGDLETQVQRMVAFIEHEARERVEEIDCKADGEYEYERGRLLQRARQEEHRAYEKRERAVVKQIQLDEATSRIQSRLRELACRDAHLTSIEAEVQRRILKATDDRHFYRDLLLKLLVQGLVRLLESKVLVLVREQDVDIVEKLFPTAEKQYQELVGARSHLMLDTRVFLPPASLGGVELSNKRRTARVVNTLAGRTQLVVRQLVPSIRRTMLDAQR